MSVKKFLKPEYIIILLLALFSYKIVDYRILTRNNLTLRNDIQTSVMAQKKLPPDNNNLLSIGTTYTFQKVVKIIFKNSNVAHLVSQNIINFVIFLLIYFAFF